VQDAVDIFSSRFCVLILNSVVDLAGSLLSGRASSAYKGIRKLEFQKISKIEASPLLGLLFRSL
jgi:hypothetical protein